MRKDQCYWLDFNYKSVKKPIAKGHELFIKRQKLNELAHGQWASARLAVDSDDGGFKYKLYWLARMQLHFATSIVYDSFEDIS